MDKKSRKIIYVLVAILLVAVVIGIFMSLKPNDKAPEFNGKNPVATIEMENGDIIKMELMPKYAPNTVNNFIALCNDKFFDGLVFHRVIEDFMIQGGGFKVNEDKKLEVADTEAKSIDGEFMKNKFDNTLSHTRGVISMARTPDFNSASSQFFICHKDSFFLDETYAGFGEVIEGMDVVDKIATTKTESDIPVEPQVIKTITVDTFGQTFDAPIYN